MGYFSTIAAALTVAVVTWVATVIWKRIRSWRDGRRIYDWLTANTRDEPGESHKSLSEISQGVRLPNDRLRIGCLRNRRILQSLRIPGHYSVWRQEQS